MKFPTRAMVFLALALCAGMAFGQGLTTGVLSGVVTDADNAVLPGVSVEAVHADTGTRYSAQTGGDGRFSFQNVRPGRYIVTVSLEGWITLEKLSFSLNRFSLFLLPTTMI